MTSDDQKYLVARIADEIWNRGELDVCFEVMAPDARYHGPHMPKGVGDRESWRQAIKMYRTAFPDSHVTYEAIYACEDILVGRWSATGTHTGPLAGLEPRGTRIALGGITIYRFSGDKIVEAWEQLDLLGMWQQLGVFSPPGHAG